MHKERVLITVKTYPTLSRKYGETVCTAGIRADGSWVRIYPVPFRRLEEKEQYKKFDWLDLDLVRESLGPAPGNFSCCRFRSIFARRAHGKRRQLARAAAPGPQYRHCPYATGTAAGGSQAEHGFTCGVQAAKIRGFIWEDDEREWDPSKVDQMRNKANQTELFPEEAWRQTFQLIPKLPYKFSYQFEDSDGRKSTLQRSRLGMWSTLLELPSPVW